MLQTPREVFREKESSENKNKPRYMKVIMCRVCGKKVTPRKRCGAGWLDETIAQANPWMITCWFACPHCRTPILTEQMNEVLGG